jgi:hypothetical protein
MNLEHVAAGYAYINPDEQVVEAKDGNPAGLFVVIVTEGNKKKHISIGNAQLCEIVGRLLSEKEELLAALSPFAASATELAPGRRFTLRVYDAKTRVGYSHVTYTTEDLIHAGEVCVRLATSPRHANRKEPQD